jgi:hypothetical protein
MTWSGSSIKLFYSCDVTGACHICSVNGNQITANKESLQKSSVRLYAVLAKANEEFVRANLPAGYSAKIEVSVTKPTRCVIEINAQFDRLPARLKYAYKNALDEAVESFESGKFVE